ncbi:MAG TPA: hypothetical protein VIV60_26990 [Polyangiaceae bacterium]
MVPRSPREDSEPVLEVSVVGTATSDGEYLQHEALSPQKPHSAVADGVTVVIRNDSTPPKPSASSPPSVDNGQAIVGAHGRHISPADNEEITATTRARLRSNGRVWFRAMLFLEAHRLSALTLAVGTLLLLSAAVIASR